MRSNEIVKHATEIALALGLGSLLGCAQFSGSVQSASQTTDCGALVKLEPIGSSGNVEWIGTFRNPGGEFRALIGPADHPILRSRGLSTDVQCENATKGDLTGSPVDVWYLKLVPSNRAGCPLEVSSWSLNPE
jgi:hypothetical protein